MSDLTALRALVTGGASGIGEATAHLLQARGAHVAVLDRAAVAEAVEQLGGLDILVNNAGLGAAGTVADNPDDEWRRVFDVNVLGMMRVARAALPHLLESDHAAIVATSVAATAGLPQRALYSSTKGAVLSLTLAMAADHAREGIRVNCVTPGTADTPWVQGLLAAADDPVAERANAAPELHGERVLAGCRVRAARAAPLKAPTIVVDLNLDERRRSVTAGPGRRDAGPAWRARRPALDTHPSSASSGQAPPRARVSPRGPPLPYRPRRPPPGEAAIMTLLILADCCSSSSLRSH